ncbi:MAG: molybdopterin molybdotransferase MoeA [Nitrospinota bacterium]|nr:molybdopterin molybdotransferase MoeA [Nitrospinota bacterium]
MITVEQALEIIVNSVQRTSRREEIPLAQAPGAVLGRDALADTDSPPFHRATMDGYAVIHTDGPGDYEVVEDIPAGYFPRTRLVPGKVSKIMTGAPLPEGADAVVPVEQTGGFVDLGQLAMIKGESRPGKNIAPRGEDMKVGDVALPAGTLIRPAEVAVLASVGCDPCHVYSRPTLAALATGDELIPPDQKPAPGQIRNSNGPSIIALAAEMGLACRSLGPAGDNPAALEENIRRGMDNDFLIISGGVSAGDRDLVPDILKKVGYKTLFHKVSVKPGKPTLFGMSASGRFVFGLPGNPVSSMVIFELFVRPALCRFMGAPYDAMEVAARMTSGFHRINAEREEYLPARLEWNGDRFSAGLVEYHGSGHFRALTRANGLVIIPAGVKKTPEGSQVRARFLGNIIMPAP